MKLERDRDAWATIRGFGYQIVLTVERWLDLNNNETLELEYGEDIDRVSKVLNGVDKQEEVRLLEQVKHLESNITLRYPAVIEAIANAFAHIAQNPGKKLYFQFTTTANVGQEQQSPLGKSPGIEVWEQLRQGKVPEGEVAQTVENLRALLLSASQPQDLPDATWALFLESVKESSADELRSFIRQFNWLFKQPDMAVDWTRLEQILMKKGHASELLEAKEQCERLVAFVLKRLSVRDKKSLSPSDLQSALKDSTLAGTGRALFAQLKTAQAVLEGRVAALESVVVRTNAAFQKLAQEHAVVSTVTNVATVPSLLPPVLVEGAAKREGVVNNVVQRLEVTTWLAFHGQVLSGKTQLAVLVANVQHNCRAWVRFGDLRTEGEAQIRLVTAISAVTEEGIPSSLSSDWLDLFCAKLGRGALLVLDGLPSMQADGVLWTTLSVLIRTASRHRVHILSTSDVPPIASCTAMLEQVEFQIERVPDFTEQDTLEVLISKGAPQAIRSLASQICVLGRQNPTLISVLIEHLRQRQWNISPEWLESVFTGEHSQQLDEETLRRLAVTVQDADNRELLYRLALITGSFGEEELRAVCEAPPPLSHALERIAVLQGPWVQRDSARTMKLSPLVDKRWKHNLISDTAVRCHRNLARVITSRSEITLTQLLAGFLHSILGKELTRAALLLAQGLNACIEARSFDEALMCIWVDKPLDEEIPLVVRAYVRNLQIVARTANGRQTKIITDDLFALLQTLKADEKWLLPMSAALAGPAIMTSEPERACELFGKVLQHPSNCVGPDGQPFEFPGEFKMEHLLWTPFSGAMTSKHVECWITVFNRLTEEQRANAQSGEFGAMGCQALAIKLITQEQARPKEQQDWNGVDAVLSKIAEQSLSLKASLLWANAIRARMIVLGDYCDQADAAVRLGEDAYQHAPAIPEVQLVLAEQIGIQLNRIPDRRSESTNWFRIAAEKTTPLYPEFRLEVRLLLSCALSDADPAGAVAAAQSAVEIAEAEKDLPELERPRALAELSVALWLGGDLPTALRTWDRATDALFECLDKDDNEWRSTAVSFGHVGGYFASLATTGTPPTLNAAGEGYSAPRMGMIIHPHQDLHTIYRGDQQVWIFTQCAMIADARGDAERAARWRKRGLDLTNAGDKSIPLAQLNLDHLPTLLNDGRLAEALEASIDAAVVIKGAKAAAAAGLNVTVEGFDFTAALGERSGEAWKEAEALGASNYFFPVGFQLLRLSLTRPQLAHSRAMEVARLCRQKAQGASEPARWNAAAELFTQILQVGREASALFQVGAELAGKQWPELVCVAYLAASVAPDATVVQALQAHTMIVKQFEAPLRIYGAAYRELVLPFFHEFWTARFQRSRFGFSQPSMVERDIQAARSLGHSAQLKALFKALAVGLGSASVPSEIWSWLEIDA